MKKFKYLIIGGGMTSEAAIQGIRENDPDGSIALISAEQNAPYDRPPLSKGLWRGEEVDDIWLSLEGLEVKAILDTRATEILPGVKSVKDEKGETYAYEKLLLATGGTPRRLPNTDADIMYFRTYRDYKRLRELSKSKKSFGILGGGFIGSEIAAALTMEDNKVTMLFPEVGIGGLIFPENLSKYLTSYYRDKGVEVHPGELVQSIKEVDGKYHVSTKSGKSFTFDEVVAGLGIQPNVELAAGAGLKVDDGIVVDKFLQTSDPSIYAAGDCASYPSPQLGERIRVEHEDNAKKMGKHAGKNLSGDQTPYEHLSFFYSDLFDHGYEAVGILDPNLEIVENWDEEFEKGVLYYINQGRVRGVLLWSVWENVDNATELISEKGPFKPEDLKDRILGLTAK